MTKLDHLYYTRDNGAFEPVTAHAADAGYDLRTPEAFRLYPNSSTNIDTGVHFHIPSGFYGKIESKSGLMCRHGVYAPGGVIDAGYTGSVVVRLTNLGRVAYAFEKGDKIAQIIFHRHEKPELVEVDTLDVQTERGGNGFGSSGR